MNKKSAGFTMIELVIVIVILGILAATALPRFINVNSQAHQAAVAGAGGGLGSAVALSHALWMAQGLTAADATAAMDGATVVFNAAGWPVGSDASGASVGTSAAPDCSAIWNGVMQNPPTVVASPATTADYTAAYAGTVCTYAYNGATGMSITYDTANGAVVVDNTP